MECDVTSTCIWFSMFPESLVGSTSASTWNAEQYDLSKCRTRHPVTYFHVPKEVSPPLQFSEEMRTWKKMFILELDEN